MEAGSAIPLKQGRWKKKAETKMWGGRNGIEPSSPGWSPGALPWLCYSRVRRVTAEQRYGMAAVGVNT